MAKAKEAADVKPVSKGPNMWHVQAKGKGLPRHFLSGPTAEEAIRVYRMMYCLHPSTLVEAKPHALNEPAAD